MSKTIQEILNYREEYKKLNTHKYKESITTDKIHKIDWVIHKRDAHLFFENEVWKYLYEQAYWAGVTDIAKIHNIDLDSIMDESRKEMRKESN